MAWFVMSDLFPPRPRMLARDTVCIEPNEIPTVTRGKDCNESSSCAFLIWVVATQIWFWNFHPENWGKDVSHFDVAFFKWVEVETTN